MGAYHTRIGDNYLLYVLGPADLYRTKITPQAIDANPGDWVWWLSEQKPDAKPSKLDGGTLYAVRDEDAKPEAYSLAVQVLKPRSAAVPPLNQLEWLPAV